MPSHNAPLPGGRRAASLYAVLAFLVPLVAVLLAYVMQLPPRPQGADAPGSVFSAGRALRHIREVATVTHPAGSFANDKVRDYIVAQLNALGVYNEVQTALNPFGDCGVYHNVLARIPGTANTKAFAMEAHYDSVPYGPGAVDDCGGVGVMLEVARILKEGPPLQNDVIFCFSDAEEINAGGARAFTEHPWVKNGEIGVLLNFEARGTSGPSYMFETSDENGWLIAEMARAGVNPRATSVMFDVFRRSPFGSDFGALKGAGIKGFNVAFVERFCHYHTRDDNPDVINLASVQHHGAYALGFARHFGNIPLLNVTAPDATYFNTLGGLLVHYPLSWGGPLALLATILFAAMLLTGSLRGHLTLRGLLAGGLCFLLAALCVIAVLGALTGAIFAVHGRYLLYNNGLYGLGLALVAVSITAALHISCRRFVSIQHLATASCFVWTALLWALQRYMPGGAYLALWPLLFGMAGITLLFAASPEKKPGRGLLLAAGLFALPAILLWVPALVGLISMATILVSAVMGFAVLLLAGFLMPSLALLEAPHKHWLPLGSGVLGLFLVAIGLATNGPNAAKPHFNCLSYGLDQDAGKAYWLSNDRSPDAWLSQFIPAGTPRADLSEFMPGHHDLYMKAPAPIAPVGGPKVSVVRDEVVDGQRRLALHIDSAEAVTQMHLYIVSPGEILASSVLGRDTGSRREHWGQDIMLFPRDGADVTLSLAPDAPLQLKIVEKIYGLPDGLNIPPRPPHLITEPNTTLDWGRPLRSEHTFITRTFEFAAAAGA